MYVYIRSEPGLWTVGHYDPQGRWQPESDHDSADKAAARVHWLNGGDAALAAEHARAVRESAAEHAADEAMFDRPAPLVPVGPGGESPQFFPGPGVPYRGEASPPAAKAASPGAADAAQDD